MEGGAPVQWLPALVFLVVGLTLGAALVWRARKGKPALAPAMPLEARDLTGLREALVRQLRELEDTASKRSPEQLARERYDLELELARALQRLDDGAPPTASDQAKTARASAPTPGTPAPPSALRGFFWGIGSMAVLALLLYFVSQSVRPREGSAPVTGNTPMAQPAAPDTQAEEREAEAAVKSNPKDVEARLRLTRVYLARQDMMAVFRETQEILKASPGNPQALSYQALVRLAMGQGDVALDMLKKALKAAPDDIEVYIHLSLVYARLGRPKDSDATIEDASRRFPDQAAMLRDVQQQIRQAAQRVATDEAGGEANPHKGVGAPGAGSEAGPQPEPAAVAAGSGDGRRVSGVVDLDPSLKGKVPAGTTIFVFVRDAGFGAGPPIAAKRLTLDQFPVPFEITGADAMRGDPIPAEILLEARADSDGDPATRSPQDPVARLDDLKTPATNVHLVLKPKTP